MNQKFGIDIGGVIIDRGNYVPGDNDFFQGNYLETPTFDYAFEAIALVVKQFRGEVFLVSSCTEAVEANTLDWFRHHRFHEITGVLHSHVRFCRERTFKNPICEELGITHFIDDRLRVLKSLVTVPHLFHFTPREDGVVKSCDEAITIRSWREVPQFFQ